MNVVHPGFLPDPAYSRAEMEALQNDIAADAIFEDAIDFSVADLALSGTPVEQSTVGSDDRTAADSSEQTTFGSTEADEADAPVVVGVDQAFTDDEALSAVVAIQDGVIVERAAGYAPLEIPYIPGLLSFREGSAIVDALESLAVDPDVLVVDGSGRIHFRQAGLATHVGVLFDVPAVGVAKNLLCGTPQESLAVPLSEGVRVPIESDNSMDAPDGTVVGYAYQSRQYPNPETRHVNPLFVSPGHRLSAATAVDVVAATCTGYKLPAPTRLADAYADELKQ